MSDDAVKTGLLTASESAEQKTDAMPVDQAEPAATEVKSSGDDAAQASEEKTETNGTETADQKAVNGDAEMSGTADLTAAESASSDKKAKRKSSGIPEHKTKKTLKHKKSVKEFHTNAQTGELYLARLKGHAPWPALIADDDMLPEIIESKRPVTAPQLDGTWKRAEYAPEGKRHHERTFAVMFLYTNEFAWVPNSELTPLTPEECKNVSEKSKSKALVAAYHEAAQGHDLAFYKGLLNDHAEALAEDEAAQEEREAEKARKAEKKAKRKSDAAAAVDDEMDVDEDGAETKPKGKKRKKASGEEDGNEKPAKTPKTTKLKLSTPKTPATGEKNAKKKEAKSGKKKTPAKVADSDEAATPVPEKELTAQEKHDKREQEVRYCRHKLQRGLLTRDNVPTDDEVKTMSTYLKKLEDYSELEASILRSTKIHKVLKAMIKLQTIPRDAEYNFKKRSMDLLQKWTQILNESTEEEEPEEKPVDKDASEKKADAAATNGEKTEKVEKSADKAEEKTEAKDDASADVKDDTKTGAIETKIEGEKEADAGKTTESATEANTDEPDVSKARAEAYQPPAEPVEATAS